MYALVGQKAKSNRGFSVGVLAEEAAGQDRGDFGGALFGRKVIGGFQKQGGHWLAASRLECGDCLPF
jgi:hypothetical protein